MFSVYAEFDSRGSADRAADRLRSTSPALGRISVRLKKRIKETSADPTGELFKAENAVFSPNTVYQSCGSPLSAMMNSDRMIAGERYYQSFDGQEHIICAEGSRETVEQASRLLRSFGGINITISGFGE